MGIRDYLRPHVTPYDAQQGWRSGDTGVTTAELSFGDFTIPKGAEVIIEFVPEAGHGVDLYGLSFVNWEGHEGCEVALSSEAAKHHFGTDAPHVRRS